MQLHLPKANSLNTADHPGRQVGRHWLDRVAEQWVEATPIPREQFEPSPTMYLHRQLPGMEKY